MKAVKAWRVLVAAAALLPAAYLASPPTAPPLYDGLGAPDEPYRYTTDPPPGATKVRPASAREEVAVEDDTNPPAVVATPEQGPQAAVIVPAGGLRLPSGARRLSLSLEPVLSPAPPVDGTMLSNAYAVEIVDERGRAVGIAETGRETTVLLRIPTATDAPVALELYDEDSGWVTLPTRRTGQDVYSAFLPQTGLVAAVQITDPGRSLQYTRDDRKTVFVLPLVAGVLLLILAVVVLRLRGRTSEHPAD